MSVGFNDSSCPNLEEGVSTSCSEVEVGVSVFEIKVTSSSIYVLVEYDVWGVVVSDSGLT